MITNVLGWFSGSKSQQFAKSRKQSPVVFQDLSFYGHSFARFDGFSGQVAVVDHVTWSKKAKMQIFKIDRNDF